MAVFYQRRMTYVAVVLLRFLHALLLKAIVNFLSMHLNILRRLDPNSHLVALDSYDRYSDLVPDNQRFVYSSRQYEQKPSPCSLGADFLSTSIIDPRPDFSSLSLCTDST